MSNSYFQFKQFIINQGSCAMKVSTEACILGAWSSTTNPSRLLDIGAGTGLLSLMLAQRFDCAIDAIEFEDNAAKQANENFKESPWHERLRLIHTDIDSYANHCTRKYDLIISNPPFFKNSLKSENKENNKAKHDDSLPQDILLKSMKKLLAENGTAYVLYPEREADSLMNLASQYKLNSKDSLIIKNRKDAAIFRKVVALGDVSKVKAQNLTIRNDSNEHSDAFNTLLKAYYLKL